MYILQVITTWSILVIIPHNSVYGSFIDSIHKYLWQGKCNLNSKKGPSPVDINTSRAIPLLSLQCRYLQLNYNDPLPIDTLENDGHTVKLTINKNKPRPYISGGTLPTLYELDHLHFHWNEHSEHTLNNKSYPMEAHLVHFNKAYSNVSQAQNYNDGLAVIGTFFELQPEDNKCLEPLIKELPRVRRPITENVNINLPVGAIIPSNIIFKPDIYQYGGSLTTGNYDEVVIWTVFECPIPISQRQLNEFRSLLDDSYNPITHNSREVQSLGDRKIYKGKCLVPKNMKKKC